MNPQRVLWLGSWLVAAPALAVPTIFNADVVTGPVAFDAAVRDAGAAVSAQRLRFLADNSAHFEFADFTIDATDGRGRPVKDDYNALREQGRVGALSGWAIGITPNAPVGGSGLTFTFRQPVNAFGLEVGDWATCCYASALYIAFDGGATRLVASAAAREDNPGWAAYAQTTNFVGAVDASGTFTRVTFYGDGLGEYLLAGGTVRYGALPVQAAPPAVPEPATWRLALAGAGWLAWRRRRP